MITEERFARDGSREALFVCVVCDYCDTELARWTEVSLTGETSCT